MPKKKTLEQEINDFLIYWNADQQEAFLREVIPLFEIFDVEDDSEWNNIVESEDERNIRLIRVVYIISRIAEFHAGKLASIRMTFRDLYKRLEKEGLYERKSITENA